jgi:hypothetical protein
MYMCFRHNYNWFPLAKTHNNVSISSRPFGVTRCFSRMKHQNNMYRHYAEDYLAFGLP